MREAERVEGRESQKGSEQNEVERLREEQREKGKKNYRRIMFQNKCFG